MAVAVHWAAAQARRSEVPCAATQQQAQVHASSCTLPSCTGCSSQARRAQPSTLLRRPTRWQRRVAASASQRQQRDPASYSSMDELWQELEGDGSVGWVTGFVQWLGGAANAARSSASPLQVRAPPGRSLGLMFPCKHVKSTTCAGMGHLACSVTNAIKSRWCGLQAAYRRLINSAPLRRHDSSDSGSFDLDESDVSDLQAPAQPAPG